MTSPIVGFKYGEGDSAKSSRSFFLIRADGSEEGISAKKCVEGACLKRKREREEADADEADAKRARIQTGCVVVIEGVPNDTRYGDMRDLLGSFGHVKYLEFIRDEPAAGESKAAS